MKSDNVSVSDLFFTMNRDTRDFLRKADDFIARYRRDEDESPIAFYGDEVPADTPHRRMAITTARQIVSELGNLTYDGQTEDDVRAVFQNVSLLCSALVQEMEVPTHEENL